ncbi:MAG: hypothetical protein M4579_004592 [Chaenotheca gracillima]|nr:MAG: hypothetical protein M4579_004592 [Chaenotheca gracillima]
MALGGFVLRTVQTVLRVIELLAAVLILGIFSYFLAVLRDHNLVIASWLKAVEGIAGAAVLYTAFAVILTLFLGGVRFFAFLAIILDICFVGAFAAVAVLNRGGTDSCVGPVNTPLGKGDASTGKSGAGFGQDGFGFGSGNNLTYAPNLRQSCKLEKACFAVAIVNVILFLITAVVQFLIARHHQKEKKFGPSPANNYTAGSRRRFGFGRNKKNHSTRDAELATGGHGIRPSHDTGYTGTTMGANDTYAGAKPATYSNGTTGQYHTATHGGQPTGYTNF